MNILDLSGTWRWETDQADQGIIQEFFHRKLNNDGFKLPGSTCENHIGQKQEYYEKLTKEAARAPRERYEYVGPLWLQREVDIPEELEGKCIRLFLERVNIASQLWLDGEEIGRQIIELSAPHRYDLTGRLTAGRHTFTLRIDNRNLLNFGDMGSGYSIDTQGLWNGAVGRIQLQWEELFHIENIQVYPKNKAISVNITLASDIWKPEDRRPAEVTLSVMGPDGNHVAESSFSSVLFNSRQVESFEIDLKDIQYWDEFTPNLYVLKAAAVSLDCRDEKSLSFGMRTIEKSGRKILLNGRQIALRGTIDCAQYPLTGYPPIDIDLWRNNFRTIKSYGLNHVRFHAWCPPECAFEAADELGVYLSIEMPLWINRDIAPLAYGDDPIHDQYYPNEARTISKTYGNHPSFVLFSNGNETLGNFELLSDITIQMRSYDPRRLYTITSNFDHPVMECEDYFSAFAACGIPVRIQNLHDEVAENTCLDYREAVEACPVPVISFEVGQYCSYPDVDLCERYTGNMLPVNFDAIRKHMKEQGIYPKLKEYIAASGDLAAKLYKEDIEAALRTKDFGGFQLLSLIDYTGQSTATVGLLNVFYESKGILSPEDFRSFCNCVVPLFKAKRIYRNTEVLEAELDLYDFGPERIEEPIFGLTLYNGDELFYEENTVKRQVRIPLDSLREATMLRVKLSVGEYNNSWRVYVYPEKEIDVSNVQSEGLEVKQLNAKESKEIESFKKSSEKFVTKSSQQVKTISSVVELKALSENGGKAIVTADLLENPVEGSFIPVFWSPVHFPTKKPSGEIIDHTHPVFTDFPTEKYPDYQWKNLLDHARCANLSGLPGLKPIVEVVPNFVDSTPSSPFFEFHMGKADFLFCGFDLEQPDLPTIQLKNCIYRYANSPEFAPVYCVEDYFSLG